ncbi:MAG: YcjX family protein [Magnetococcales bacterium]|nr:YcjX family protein [Magnetococcales bacterium]
MAIWSLDSIFDEARRTVDNWVHLAMDRTVRLAVTGLNQSGKTVFITTLIHQLLNASRGGRLPFFRVIAEGRFRGAKIIQQPNLDVSTFRYDQFIRSLTGPDPSWPQATDGLSEIRLAIRFQPAHFLQRQVQPLVTLYLDIIDYPGEWLLDLPLLDLSFEAWSAQVLKLCEFEPRAGLARDWLDYLHRLDPNRTAEEEIIRTASALYTQFLLACKEPRAGLNYLQPGRFLIPGELRDTPLLAFCPLPVSGESRYPGSYHEAMNQRFNSYRDRVVRAFYHTHFSRFDRQIVLVDPLKGLNAGFGAFSDMEKTLHSILGSFNYGPSGILYRLLKPRIDKLLFAASKVDHVAANQHHNLERMLERLVAMPTNDALFQGVAVKTMALSSVRCTETVVREHDGRRLSFVKGIPKDQDEEVLLYPGEIPETLPDPADWSRDRFNFMEFRPPRGIELKDGVPPHIHLDQALEYLLGDKLH